MKHRWIGVPLLAATMALGACAPTQQGTDEDESEVPATTEATASAEATEEAAATAKPAPDYDY